MAEYYTTSRDARSSAISFVAFDRARGLAGEKGPTLLAAAFAYGVAFACCIRAAGDFALATRWKANGRGGESPPAGGGGTPPTP